MAATPHILAKTLKDAHAFANEELGLPRGKYRVVTSPSSISSVRGADLYLVPGYEKRFDRFAMKGAIRWTRLNVIDVAAQKAEEPPTVVVVAVPDDTPVPQHHQDMLARVLSRPDGLEPPGVQMTLVSDEEAAAFVATETSNGDNMIAEGGPVSPEEPQKNRRRRRCKDCGTLHFKGDSCPSDVLPGT